MSSNQVLEISGNFQQLESVLRFVLDYSNISEKGLVFQTTKDGKFCIGWGDGNGLPFKGWEKFQFEHSLGTISKIIIEFLSNWPGECESPYDYFDGSTDVGFIMKCIPDLQSDDYNNIKNPFYGIVSFERYVNFYAK